MASNTSDFFTFSKTAGTAKNLQKPTDGGDNNLWGGFINVDLDTIVGAVNATSDLIADANQNELVDFTATGSAVNHVGITNAATGNGPTIEAKGDDTNIDLNVSGKGTGALASTGAKLTSPKVITGVNDTNGNELVKVTATGSAVNEITVANAATGNGPTLSATGDDTNIDLNIAGKGTGEIEIASNIAFSNDTDAKVKLPSGGGIYESDGSTEILTESGGAVTLKNTTIDSNVIFPAGGTGNPISVAVIADQKSQGSDGGTFSPGDWRDRDINTELYDSDGIVSIESDSIQFTLGAGTYYISAIAPTLMVDNHKIRLYNTTDSTVVATGVSCYSNNGTSVANDATLSTAFAITGSKSFKIQHRGSTQKTGNGFGASMNLSGSVEIYTTVTILKLK